MKNKLTKKQKEDRLLKVYHDIYYMNLKLITTKNKTCYRRSVTMFNKKYVPLGYSPIDAEKEIKYLLDEI